MKWPWQKKPKGHRHRWIYEMSGPDGMERDYCEECRARRYRGFGADLVEDYDWWRKTPPVMIT